MKCPKCGATHILRDISQEVMIREEWNNGAVADYHEIGYWQILKVFLVECLECKYESDFNGEWEDA